jgi:transposase
MKETIRMSRTEQRRIWVLTKVLTGELTVAEATELLGLSERSIYRLRARLERDGPAGLVHGNRGRPSPRRLDEATRARIVALAEDTYHDVNDSHLADLLAEQEGITIGRSSLRRLLRGESRPSRRKRRAPKHRSRRDRMPREGLLLQTDGSRHDWLEGRGPRLTLVGYIDDATGRVTGAVFREQEAVVGQ